MDATTHAEPQPANFTLRDQIREAKFSCESTAIILDAVLLARPGPDAGELENLRNTAGRTIAALQALLAVLAACSMRGGGHA